MEQNSHAIPLTEEFTNSTNLPIGSKVRATQTLIDQNGRQLFTEGRSYDVTGYNKSYPGGVILKNDTGEHWMVLTAPGKWGATFVTEPRGSSEQRTVDEYGDLVLEEVEHSDTPLTQEDLIENITIQLARYDTRLTPGGARTLAVRLIATLIRKQQISVNESGTVIITRP